VSRVTLTGRHPMGRRPVWPWAVAALISVLVPLTVGVGFAGSAPSHGQARWGALSAPIRPAPAKVPNGGCPAKPQYHDTHLGQNFLCGNAPNKVFRAGPLDVVRAGGKGDVIWAQNSKPNEIYGVAGVTAYVDSVDCPVHGIPRSSVDPGCAARKPAQSSSVSHDSAVRSRSPMQIIPASPLDGPYSCSPSPPDPGISGDGWIGWSWDKGGPCYYLIPPDVHCTETDGQLIVDAQAPQMAAVDANHKVVDWQFVAWSMVIYKENTDTQPPTWTVVQQTPFYWSKPTDLFDVPLSAVAPNNWRVFSAANDDTPAFSTHAGTFRMPGLGTYTFNFSYEWYGAPSAGAGLKALPQASYLEFVSGYHLNARSRATVVPVYPALPDLAWDPAACNFN
jgi:hypothetical protein